MPAVCRTVPATQGSRTNLALDVIAVNTFHLLIGESVIHGVLLLVGYGASLTLRLVFRARRFRGPTV